MPYGFGKPQPESTSCLYGNHADGRIAEQRLQHYVRLNEQLMAKWIALFPNYAWTDPETAIDLMAAEITTLRHEAAARAEAERELEAAIWEVIAHSAAHWLPAVALRAALAAWKATK